MIYIKKGKPPQAVALKIAEIKRSDEWKKIPDERPSKMEDQPQYTAILRDKFNLLPKDKIRENLLKEQHY